MAPKRRSLHPDSQAPGSFAVARFSPARSVGDSIERPACRVDAGSRGGAAHRAADRYDHRARGLDLRARGLDLRARGLDLRARGLDLRARGPDIRARSPELRDRSLTPGARSPGLRARFAFPRSSRRACRAARPREWRSAKGSVTSRQAFAVTASDLDKEMLKRFDHLHDQNLYDVLAVVPIATSEDIRRAYYDLARRFHPDKCRDEASKAKAEKVFAHITEAYSTLSQPESRKKYDTDQNRTRRPQLDKSADAAEMARQNFKHGKELSDKGKFGEALSFLENACEQDHSKAEYFHYLGRTQARNPRWKKKAEESLLKAIEMAPSDPRIYVDLGALYAKGGMQSRAAEMYRKALEWDPANEEAQQGLAALAGGKRGLLGSIFGKG
jgi:tetratricopeptide (TPR) repeat protein